VSEIKVRDGLKILTLAFFLIAGVLPSLQHIEGSSYQVPERKGLLQQLASSIFPSDVQASTGSNQVYPSALLQDDIYTLQVNIVGSGSVSKDPDQDLYPEGQAVTLTATPATGWTFAGWSGDLSGTVNPAVITMDGNKSVTATFTINTYQLTVVQPANGSITPTTASYNYGTVVT
jgi:uncharacterized repeat protein (TIGR02543 family)